jgi:hypothetical protein
MSAPVVIQCEGDGVCAATPDCAAASAAAAAAAAAEREAAHIFVVLGSGRVLFLMSIMSAPPFLAQYYRYAAHDEHAAARHPQLWRHMVAWIVAIIMLGNLAAQTATASHRGQRLPVFARLAAGLAVNMALIVVITALPIVGATEGIALATLVLCCVGGTAATGVYSSTVAGLAAKFPARYTQRMLFGLGLSMVAASAVQLATRQLLRGSYAAERAQATLFFSLALLGFAACAVALRRLRANAFAAQCAPDFAGALLDASASVTLEAAVADPAEEAGHLSRVANAIAPLMVANFMSGFVALLVFPGLAVSADLGSAWFAVLVVFVFALGEAVGRWVCRFPAVLVGEHALLPLAVARCAFFPLFVACVNPKWITGHAAPYALTLATGLSHGYVSSLSMMYAPASARLRPGDRAAAGSLMSLMLMLGGAAGSVTGVWVTTNI